jgi:hypothetical protein
MTAVIVLLVIVILAALGGALVLLRGMRHLSTDKYAVIERRYAGLRPITSRTEILRHHTKVVLGGQFTWSPPWLYRVVEYDYIRVPPRTVGVIEARVGAKKPDHRRLARHVECDRFEDTAMFLDGGGERGVQQELLSGGEYAINPLAFYVYTVDNLPKDGSITRDDLQEVSVDSEDVGVVTVRDAPAPDDLNAPAPVVPGHAHFQKPWVFLANGGRSGPQAEVLPGGGTYAINPLFASVVHIPTRELTLSWQAQSDGQDRYDSELAPIKVTIQGYGLQVELTQTLSIPPEAAPYLVKRFGEDADGDVGDRKSTAVKRFVGKVLGQKVKGYFTERASKAEIDTFVHELADLRERLANQVAKALEELQVTARETTIGEIVFDSDELNQEYRECARLQQQYHRHEQELRNERVVSDIKREQLEVLKAQLAAKEEVLIKLFTKEHRMREREAEIAVRAIPPAIIVPGGMPIGYPGGPSIPGRPADRIPVPTFDPALPELDILDTSPGVSPAEEDEEDEGKKVR